MYVFVLFCTHLIILYSEFFCQLFTFLFANLSIFGVDFIANQNFYDIFSCMSFYLFKPILHSNKSRSIINSIGHNNPHGTFIISLRDSFKSLLSCSIPYLHSYLFTININSLYFKINPFILDNVYLWWSNEIL